MSPSPTGECWPFAVRWNHRGTILRACGMSCFCGQTHTSLATALACAQRLEAPQSAVAGDNTGTPGAALYLRIRIVHRGGSFAGHRGCWGAVWRR